MARPRLPRAKMAKWLKFERKRLKFQRLATDVKALQEPIEQELEQLVREHGGDAKCLADARGWRLFLEGKRKNVDWKGHYIRQVGDKGAEAAEKLREEQPTEDVLRIEAPPGSLDKSK